MVKDNYLVLLVQLIKYFWYLRKDTIITNYPLYFQLNPSNIAFIKN
jgi:hypothetical protein